jgi:pilus assembly protein CpaE
MQKDAITLQILGGNTPKLTQHRTQISTMLNKEITTVQIDPSAPPGLLFKDKKLPSILIFLLDNLTIDALNQLTAIPAAIRPALLVIAEDNNSQMMRLAMQAGARDFFTEPVDRQEIHKALNQIIFDLRRGHSQQGTLTTILNAKGGSGGSFIACNLAHTASIVSDSSVVLMDFDLQFGSQSLNLDLRPRHTIVEAISDINKLDFDAIDGYMVKHNSGLRLLSTMHEQVVLPGEVDLENLDHLLTLMISNYDRIFVDIPRQIDPVSATVLERSDQILIVLQQSLAHMRDAQRLIRILKSELNISDKNIQIVINRFDPKSNLQPKDIQATLACASFFVIPNDFETVSQSTNLGRPVFDYARNSAITTAIIALAEELNVKVKEEYKEQSFFKKLLKIK